MYISIYAMGQIDPGWCLRVNVAIRSNSVVVNKLMLLKIL